MTEHVLAVFLGFFAIMNPLANTAVFVGLTQNLSDKEQKQLAGKALFTSFIVILSFALLGNTLFHFFGITLPALRIAGGILVFIIGYQMLSGKHSELHAAGRQDVSDIAISPLAIPILAGPGTIATAMNYSATGVWLEIGITISMFACLCLVTYGCFMAGNKLMNWFGETGLTIVTRLMGLILTVIAVQMTIGGIDGALTQLHVTR